MRFRRSIKLAPGLRLNFSGSGVGLSAGPRGASVSFGSRGTYLNSGIPGTGLSSRTRLDAPARALPKPSETVTVRAEVKVDDDGNVQFFDKNGVALSNDYLTTQAKRQHGGKIRDFLEETSREINAQRESLAQIHLHTPSPSRGPQRPRAQFETPPPTPPTPKAVGVFQWLLGRRSSIEALNAENESHFQEDLADWTAAKKKFEAREAAADKEFVRSMSTDVGLMEHVLEQTLQDIVWPRETLVSLDLSNDGRTIRLDVDLPEIEDMPRKASSLPARGYKLSIKMLKDKPLRELYARHVCGIGFRIIGEVFATLPAIEEVILSAFTQRIDPQTGHEADVFIYSTKVKRSEWAAINFQNLGALDIAGAFDGFECRRKVSRSGLHEQIIPF